MYYDSKKMFFSVGEELFHLCDCQSKKLILKLKDTTAQREIYHLVNRAQKRKGAKVTPAAKGHAC